MSWTSQGVCVARIGKPEVIVRRRSTLAHPLPANSHSLIPILLSVRTRIEPEARAGTFSLTPLFTRSASYSRDPYLDL